MNNDQLPGVHAIVVMGVSGSGKTTVGRTLADTLGWTFYEGDDFHPEANVEKMSHGTPLDDADRAPWLDALCELIAGIIARDEHGVIACSALKQSYRDALVPRGAPPKAVRFVFLDVPVEELRRRVAHRQHFFPPALLDSQLATLELPHDAVRVNGAQPVDAIAREALETLAS